MTPDVDNPALWKKIVLLSGLLEESRRIDISNPGWCQDNIRWI